MKARLWDPSRPSLPDLSRHPTRAKDYPYQVGELHSLQLGQQLGAIYAWANSSCLPQAHTANTSEDRAGMRPGEGPKDDPSAPVCKLHISGVVWTRAMPDCT